MIKDHNFRPKKKKKKKWANRKIKTNQLWPSIKPNIIAKLGKKGKFNDKAFFKLCPSDTLTKQLYGIIKAHKLKKTILWQP